MVYWQRRLKFLIKIFYKKKVSNDNTKILRSLEVNVTAGQATIKLSNEYTQIQNSFKFVNEMISSLALAYILNESQTFYETSLKLRSKKEVFGGNMLSSLKCGCKILKGPTFAY